MKNDFQRSVERYISQLQKSSCVSFTADAIGHALGVNRYDVLVVLDDLLAAGVLRKTTPTLFGFGGAQ